MPRLSQLPIAQAVLGDERVAALQNGQTVTVPAGLLGGGRGAVDDLERLRRARIKIMARSLEQPARLSVLVIGDALAAPAVATATQLLHRFLGNAGTGYVSFNDPAALRPWMVGVSDLWQRASAPVPSLFGQTCATAGQTITVANAPGVTLPALSAARLFLVGLVVGQLRWRWSVNNVPGPWTVSNFAKGATRIVLTGHPAGALANAGAGQHKVEIELLSGSVTLGGIDFESATSGAVVHALTEPGLKMADVLTHTTAAFANQWAALQPDVLVWLAGPADQTANTPIADLSAQTDAVLAWAAETFPTTDRMIVSAPETPRGFAPAMPEYALALRPLARKHAAAWLDLQPDFGDAALAPQTSVGGALPLFGLGGDTLTADGALLAGRALAGALLG